MSKPSTIDLPADLAAEAAEAARAAGEDLSTFVARAVAFELERERTDRFFAERRQRADVAKALELLRRSGGQLPEPGDELPPGYKPAR
ncbi:MAG TPA: hypothetical protein VEA80_19135 [Vitreimonas sp.]|uniref:hypothetical protein n=1 Tax=Vitreimonas sp. TaxID=3069702 RepID=UPI002D496995|nr:hypothetical protein [Vitreimonas sp.]HYD89603.1 hypothetical protein [Vitreimonas sp.]